MFSDKTIICFSILDTHFEIVIKLLNSPNFGFYVPLRSIPSQISNTLILFRTDAAFEENHQEYVVHGMALVDDQILTL